MTSVIHLPPVFERYFKTLEAGHFDGAAECFTEDVFYSHPPYSSDLPGSPRHEAHGRAALLRLFHRRGLRPYVHRIDAWAISGERVFISGVSLSPEENEIHVSFVSEAVLDDAGRIRWYAAYSSLPAVGASTNHRV
jgi:hypothetical protein